MQKQGKTELDPSSLNGAFEAPIETGVMFQLADGLIQTCNPQAEKLLGLTIKQMQGRTSIDLPWKTVHEDGSPFPSETHPTMVTLQTGQAVERVMGVCRPTGLIWLKVSANPLFLANSTTPYAVVTTFVKALPEQSEPQKLSNRPQFLPEERYRSLFESIDDGFCLIKVLFDENNQPINYRFLETNPAFETQTGLTQAVGKTVRQLIPNLEDHWIETYGKVTLTGESLRFESRSDVMNRWFDAYAFRFGQPENREVAIFFRDISERKRVEADLQKANQTNNRILESITDAFIAFDTEWRFTYVNQAAERLFQCSRAHLMGRSAWEVFPAEEQTDTYRELHRSLAEQIPVQYQYFSPSLNLYVEVNAYPAAEGLAIYWRDISDQVREESERKRIEQELQESGERFLTLADNIAQLAWMADEHGRSFWYNQRWFDYTGTTAEEMQGWGWQKVHHPEYIERVTEKFRQHVEAGEVWEDTFPLRSHDEQYGWFLSRAIPIRDAQGKVLRWFGTNTDISDRVRIEEELRQKNAILDVINKSAPTPIFVKDRQGRIIYANPATLTVLGKTTEEVVGRYDSDLYPFPEDAARVMENDRRIMAAGQTEVVEESPDGIRTFLGMKAPYRNEAGEVIGLIGISNDISDRIQIERDRERILQQEQAAREAAERANRIKDEFLAVLSHELRTPLNPILGWSRLLQTGKLDAEKSAAALVTIERNAKLQSQLIEDLLHVSRILQGKLLLNQVPVDLATTIEAALETVRLAAESKKIQIQTRFDPQVSQISGDSGRLQQVIWNLLSNAVKFTPEEGGVEIRLRQIDRVVQIQVIDTGKGIQADFLPHVFEHFRQEDGATTRKFGGLGLGLAIVKQLVELHGGTIHADSPGEGQGATFTVQLPCVSQSSDLTEETSESTPGGCSLGGLRILVVDDDEDSREFVGFVLEQEGATVKMTEGAIAALQLLDQDFFDLLVSDIGMPEMDGYMLIQQIRCHPRYGKIPAIALTAYAGEANERQVLQAGFQRHLAKPIDPEELVTQLRQVIGQPLTPYPD